MEDGNGDDHPEETSGFALVEADGFRLVDRITCVTCGDTGVVQRSAFPLAKPAPGHIDAVGRCPICGGGEPPEME